VGVSCGAPFSLAAVKRDESGWFVVVGRDGEVLLRCETEGSAAAWIALR
jgi:hypothetical protein